MSGRNFDDMIKSLSFKAENSEQSPTASITLKVPVASKQRYERIQKRSRRGLSKIMREILEEVMDRCDSQAS